MHHWKHKILLLGALGLSACGMFQTPSKFTSPNTDITPNINFEAQGTPIVCTNQSAGGSFPYNSNGPLWRQQFFLNDNGTPLNYSTFSTDLPAVSNISMNPYVINATGGSYTPQPWMYQYIYAPNVTLSGTQSTGAVANNVVTSVSGTYGLLYNNSLKQFELPISSGTNTKFKLFDAAGNVLPTEYGASQTYYPSINNNRVRIPTGQKVTLEFYLDPKVQYRKELIWATFKDASGVSKTDWVTVNMPYQEGILKVNAATYTVQEATGIKTYQSATNPLPKFKFVMRGYNNLVSSDRQFLSRQGIYYTWPSSVPSGDWAAWNQFMDERKDYVLNWNLYDQKVGSASVDASGDPVLNATTVSTAAQWNLGTPGYANDKNCISKTFAPEYGSQQRFSVIQPAATVYSGATFTETQQGLKAEYFDNPDFTGKRVERLNSQINFNWGGYSPAPFISPETYSVRWSGTIKPEFSGDYTFYFTGGQAVRLIVDGDYILSGYNLENLSSRKVSLTAGVSYSFMLEYVAYDSKSFAKLEWSSDSQVKTVVPIKSLTPFNKILHELILKVPKYDITANEDRENASLKEDSDGYTLYISDRGGNGYQKLYFNKSNLNLMSHEYSKNINDKLQVYDLLNNKSFQINNISEIYSSDLSIRYLKINEIVYSFYSLYNQTLESVLRQENFDIKILLNNNSVFKQAKISDCLQCENLRKIVLGSAGVFGLAKSSEILERAMSSFNPSQNVGVSIVNGLNNAGSFICKVVDWWNSSDPECKKWKDGGAKDALNLLALRLRNCIQLNCPSVITANLLPNRMYLRLSKSDTAVISVMSLPSSILQVEYQITSNDPLVSIQNPVGTVYSGQQNDHDVLINCPNYLVDRDIIFGVVRLDSGLLTPLTMHVTCFGDPKISVNPSPVVMHGVKGGVVISQISIQNSGFGDLVASISGTENLQINPKNIAIKAISDQNISISAFCNNNFTGEINVSSNDPLNPEIRVPVEVYCSDKDNSIPGIAIIYFGVVKSHTGGDIYGNCIWEITWGGYVYLSGGYSKYGNDTKIQLNEFTISDSKMSSRIKYSYKDSVLNQSSGCNGQYEMKRSEAISAQMINAKNILMSNLSLVYKDRPISFSINDTGTSVTTIISVGK